MSGAMSNRRRIGRLQAICVLFLPWFVPVLLFAQVAVTHGPLVGAVTHQSAKFLVRTDAQAEIRIELDTDSTFPAAMTTEPVMALPERDFFAVVPATGLAADTKYYYRVLVGDTPLGEIRSFSTFPEPGTVTNFTFAFGGCQQNFHDAFSNIGRVWPLVVAEQPRFFLQLGDWTYPDTTDTPQNPQNYFATDYALVQSSYHTKYSPDYPMSELFKIAPIDYVYDDHDYTNDNSDRTYAGRENSLRGYDEMFPHYDLPNGQNGIWHKFTFGNADFFMLDCRSQRAPNLEAFVQDPATGRLSFSPGEMQLLLQSDTTISGELQMDWLLRELKASTATWKFIGTSVPFNPAHSRAIVELALLLQGTDLDPVPIEPEPMSAAEIAVAFSDMWGGFPRSVARLVKEVHDAGIRNVIMLSGDSHTAGIDDGTYGLFPECMAGALDRENSKEIALAQSFGIVSWNQGGQTIELNNFNSHYGKISVFGDDSVRMELIDEEGTLITSYTQPAGHLVETVALTLAPQGQDFGDVLVGEVEPLPIIFMNTGADPVNITKLTFSDPQFSAFFFGLTLQPGEAKNIGFLFRPQQEGQVVATLTIESNDPQSPFIVPMVGRGVVDTTTGISDQGGRVPESYALLQNFPNPFNAGTRISYALPQASGGSLRIYNMAGQEIRHYRFREQKPGWYHIGWDGRDRFGRAVATGLYIYRLEARSLESQKKFVQSRKMMYLQ